MVVRLVGGDFEGPVALRESEWVGGNLAKQGLTTYQFYYIGYPVQ